MGEWNDTAWRYLESALIPPSPDLSNTQFMAHILGKALLATATLPVVATTSCFASLAYAWKSATDYFNKAAQKDPNNFYAILKDSKLWKQLPNIKNDLEKTPPGMSNKKFLWGVGTSTFQDTRCEHSQWVENEKRLGLDSGNDSHCAPNLFNLYRTDPDGMIERLHKLGINSYRFSVEWSLIEPEKGSFIEENLAVYVNFCKQLRKAGIEPILLLQHFSEPMWFYKLGSFEKEENISHYLQFVTKVFPYFIAPLEDGKPLVELFFAMNEPNIDALGRYVLGSFLPGIRGSFAKATKFLKTELKAYASAYKALKQIAATAELEVTIGFTFQYLRFIPTNPLLIPITRYFNRLVTDSVLSCLRTGIFEVKIPFLCNIVEPLEIPTDILGVQYYVRPVIGFRGETSMHNEPSTLMSFHEDPEGIYEAILEVYKAANARRTPEEKVVDLLVSETGISTASDEQRDRYLTRSLFAFREAGKILGSHLRGMVLWCFTKTCELGHKWQDQDFGAYAVNDRQEIAKEPKAGMATFIRVAQSWKKSIEPPEEPLEAYDERELSLENDPF